MKEPVIAIFDIGKTNKKLLLFNEALKIIFEIEEKFVQLTDEDGFECEDIDRIETWINESLSSLVRSDEYDLKAVNFSTYGATIAYLDEKGERLTPVYNYLKPVDEKIPERLYRKNGGRDEFCRRTASPALGMLNSGIQALWLKTTRPELFGKVRHILHLPQYFSYRLTGKIYSEHTSIGCHTALWDFDNMKYHSWVNAHGLNLPEPVPVETSDEITIDGKKIRVGIGIHDSSASLAPYFTLNKGKFLLLSTGTWCINMNPFNDEKLTTEQLDKDCLCYMSITRQPVKSSRLFLGHLHAEGIKMINSHFKKGDDYYKRIRTDRNLLAELRSKTGREKIFFQSDAYSRELREHADMYNFRSYEEAYHQLMIELCDLTIESIKLVLPESDDIENLYITGGFSNNVLFLYLICEAFQNKKVYTTEISNGSALGAALVIAENKPVLNLDLTECKMD